MDTEVFLVEECLKKVGDHFRLVVMAAHRAQQLSSGVSCQLSRDGEKSPLVALREIGAGVVNKDLLEESLVKGFQAFIPMSEEEKGM